MANIKIFKDFHEQYFTKMKTFGNLFIVRNLNNTKNIKQSFTVSLKMNSHILFKERQHQEHLILHYQYNNQ